MVHHGLTYTVSCVVRMKLGSLFLPAVLRLFCTICCVQESWKGIEEMKRAAWNFFLLYVCSSFLATSVNGCQLHSTVKYSCSRRFKPHFWELPLKCVDSEPTDNLHWLEFVLRVPENMFLHVHGLHQCSLYWIGMLCVTNGVFRYWLSHLSIFQSLGSGHFGDVQLFLVFLMGCKIPH